MMHVSVLYLLRSLVRRRAVSRSTTPIPDLNQIPEISSDTEDDHTHTPALSPSSAHSSSPNSLLHTSPTTQHSHLTSPTSSPTSLRNKRLFHPTRWAKRSDPEHASDELLGLGITAEPEPFTDWQLIDADTPSYAQGQRHAPPTHSNSRITVFSRPHPQVTPRRVFRPRRSTVSLGESSAAQGRGEATASSNPALSGTGDVTRNPNVDFDRRMGPIMESVMEDEPRPAREKGKGRASDPN